MWKFKPFMHKEQIGLEGHAVDVGKLKLHVQKAIAEGGFSCVYLARDALNISKQYALKHIICNDDESLDLVMKEISVMKSLREHPNVVRLYAHTIFNMGRTKEALLAMEFCDKSLVSVLENRGVGYFDEKQALVIFRDVCNAVFAMHCQSPPIAHRDLKAENLLLSSDGSWKLCDFGSTSTNHKCFEKPEEMGIEEDNIRKYTTPAYRAPEMWDLFRRDFISEKVDIWALGCLLFRICYFKNAFDGDSKLQVLNGNYRIPELPKYSSSITDLIRDMLQSSPDDRPDITQVWFRVNELLPVNLQKSLPDRPPELQFQSSNEGIPSPANKSPAMPRRSPPPPPASVEPRSTSQSSFTSKGLEGGGQLSQLGAFWSTQHAKDSHVIDNRNRPDEEPTTHHISSKHDGTHPDRLPPKNVSPQKVENVQKQAVKTNIPGKVHKPDNTSFKDFKTTYLQKDTDRGPDRPTASSMDYMANFPDKAFTSFVAEFDTSKLNTQASNNKSEKEEALQIEVQKLKEQLKQVNMEKAEITSKYEKLSAICRSQRQEIHDLKQSLAARTPNKDAQVNQTSSGVQSFSTSVGKVEVNAWEHQHRNSDRKIPSSEPTLWQAFSEEPKPQQSQSADRSAFSVRTRNGHESSQGAQPTSDFDKWGFETDQFIAAHAGSAQIPPTSEGKNSQGFVEGKNLESKSTFQPAGWSGF